jgi:hypothetical protein
MPRRPVASSPEIPSLSPLPETLVCRYLIDSRHLCNTSEPQFFTFRYRSIVLFVFHLERYFLSFLEHLIHKPMIFRFRFDGSD